MKVSIDREELVKLREHVHMLVTERGDFREPAWLDAMTLLNAMIGKGEDHSVCKGCHFDGGDCYSQKKLGGWVNSCAMRVPATPPTPQVTMAKGTGFLDEGHGAFVDVGRKTPEYVTRQEMEEAIDAARAKHTLDYHEGGNSVGGALKKLDELRGAHLAYITVAEHDLAVAIKEHEEKRHTQQTTYRLTDTGCWVRDPD